MKTILLTLLFFVSSFACAAGEYCTSSISSCQAGDIIVVGGDDIPRYCDFSQAIVSIRVVHNKVEKNGTSISINIVSCVYSGNDRKK